MKKPALAFSTVLAALAKAYGAPTRSEPEGAFEMVLWENASYLVSDETRAQVHESLVTGIGKTPEAIASAKKKDVERAIAAGGMLVSHRADKVIRAAKIALGMGEPLDALVKKDLATARRVLRKMPSIGAPGADKIALFAGGHAVMSLDSNGLRVLVRLGFGKEDARYEKSVAGALAAIAHDLPEKPADLIRAHLLLRAHGKTRCKAKSPACGECVLREKCPSAIKIAGATAAVATQGKAPTSSPGTSPAGAPESPTPTFFPTPARFRAWLEKHHASKTELWVGFHKRDTGKPSLTWPESVDCALCFGWIDGVRKSLGPESYVIRFTPRKAKSKWSQVNVKRVPELIALGLMRAAGKKAFDARDKEAVHYSYEQRRAAAFTPEEEGKLRADAEASLFFAEQAPWYRRTATHWVISAKKEETRARRLATLIADSREGRKIAPLRYS